jgi:hypothetical protein
VPGRKQAGLCGGVGRMQPLVPLLLYVAVGEAEQPLSPLPAGVVHSTHGQVASAVWSWLAASAKCLEFTLISPYLLVCRLKHVTECNETGYFCK